MHLQRAGTDASLQSMLSQDAALPSAKVRSQTTQTPRSCCLPRAPALARQAFDLLGTRVRSKVSATAGNLTRPERLVDECRILSQLSPRDQVDALLQALLRLAGAGSNRMPRSGKIEVGRRFRVLSPTRGASRDDAPVREG